MFADDKLSYRRERIYLLVHESRKLRWIQEQSRRFQTWLDTGYPEYLMRYNRVSYLVVSWPESLLVVDTVATGSSRCTLYLHSNPHEKRPSDPIFLAEKNPDQSTVCPTGVPCTSPRAVMLLGSFDTFHEAWVITSPNLQLKECESVFASLFSPIENQWEESSSGLFLKVVVPGNGGWLPMMWLLFWKHSVVWQRQAQTHTVCISPSRS